MVDLRSELPPLPLLFLVEHPVLSLSSPLASSHLHWLTHVPPAQIPSPPWFRWPSRLCAAGFTDHKLKALPITFQAIFASIGPFMVCARDSIMPTIGIARASRSTSSGATSGGKCTRRS